MSIIIDKLYLGMVASRLRNYKFKYSGSSILAFSHSCERAESNKRRGHFLVAEGKLFFKCHNCGASSIFGKFLSDVDPTLASEYRMAVFKDGIYGSTSATVKQLPKILTESIKCPILPGLISFKDIDANHPARQYLNRRMIPPSIIDTLYIAPKFFEWASQFESVFKTFRAIEPRLVIPYIGEDGGLLGYACRAFGKETPKYIQLRLDKDKDFIYGANNLTDGPIITFEGQVDSFFIENAIAIGSANYASDYLKRIKNRAIIVPDNDFRRNKHVCKQLQKAITEGFTVSLLPDSWPKDINDCIISGMSAQTIRNYIITNQKCGAAAMLELTTEKKVQL